MNKNLADLTDEEIIKLEKEHVGIKQHDILLLIAGLIMFYFTFQGIIDPFIKIMMGEASLIYIEY